VVQRAFYPEGRAVPHVYVLHPPGGIVGGDRLHLDVDVQEGAQTLLTTPAATKVYRTAGARALQQQSFAVEQGAALEWLPSENILHDGAAIDLRTAVHLAADARFIGTEMLCFGLPARRAEDPPGAGGFGQGRCRQLFDLWRAGRPLLLERGRYDGAAAVHRAAWGLGEAPVVGMLVATPAPVDPELLGLLRAVGSSDDPGRADLAHRGERMGVTRLADTDTLVARYVGPSPERARAFLHGIWALLRPVVMRRSPVFPRIWAT
jgi:urease accessory protein